MSPLRSRVACRRLQAVPTEGGERRHHERNVALSFAGLLSAAGVAVCLLVESAAGGLPIHHRIPWLAVAVVLGAARYTYIPFVLREHSVRSNLIWIPTLVGIVYLEPAWFFLSVAITSLLYFHIVRPQWYKALFNAANNFFASAGAFGIYHLVADHASPVYFRGWIAAFGASLGYELLTVASVSAAVRMSSGRLDRRVLGGVFFATLLLLPLTTIFALLTVVAIWTNRWSAVLILALAAGATVWHKSHQKLRQRHATLELLYTFTQELAELYEAREVLVATLREAKQLMNAAFSELVVQDETIVTRYRLVENSNLEVLPWDSFGGIDAIAVANSGPVLAPRHTKKQVLRQALDERGFRDALAYRLPGGPFTRVLVIADRLGETTTFDHNDTKLLEALGAHAAVAIRGSVLLDQLRDEVTSREYQALHDSLTGLGNRSLFARRMSSALASRSAQGVVAVMLMDLDGFKDINDTMGHQTGDTVLQTIANRLVSAVASDGLATRLGGDEFAVIVPEGLSRSGVAEMARRIVDTVAAPLSVESLNLRMGASVGVALCPDHGQDTSTLLKRADVAMYAAKSSGTGVQVYDPSEDHHSHRRLMLANELKEALDADGFEVWYQPKAEIKTGNVVGWEALLRWNHALYGSVPPDEFIPVAERVGLIGPLTWWVLHQALAQLRSWRDAGFDVGVAVNLSAKSLLDAGLVGRLQLAIEDAGVPPSCLTLELTESSVMADADRSERVLKRLAALGIRIAIDDFGTGYSSFSRLQRLPVHELKVDKSFVTDMDDLKENAAIVGTTIDLAMRMGYQVTAEGVEDQSTWDHLGRLGCDHVQGYWLAKPMPADQCAGWLEAHHLSPHLELLRAPRAAIR